MRFICVDVDKQLENTGLKDLFLDQNYNSDSVIENGNTLTLSHENYYKTTSYGKSYVYGNPILKKYYQVKNLDYTYKTISTFSLWAELSITTNIGSTFTAKTLQFLVSKVSQIKSAMFLTIFTDKGLYFVTPNRMTTSKQITTYSVVGSYFQDWNNANLENETTGDYEINIPNTDTVRVLTIDFTVKTQILNVEKCKQDILYITTGELANPMDYIINNGSNYLIVSSKKSGNQYLYVCVKEVNATYTFNSGDITCTNPQDINTTASPYFANVGIGITPAKRLHIEASGIGAAREFARIKNTDTGTSNICWISLYSGSSANTSLDLTRYGGEYSNVKYAGFGSVEEGNNGLILNAYGSSGIIKMLIGSSSTEKVRVNSNGLGVNLTPSYPLHVGSLTTTGTDIIIVAQDGTPATRWYLRNDGIMYAYGAVQGAWSDQRLKNSIVQIENVLDKFMQINIIKYKWNEELNLDDKEHYGIIAQQLNSIFPELTYTTSEKNKYKKIKNNQGLHDVEIVEDPKPEDNPEDYTEYTDLMHIKKEELNFLLIKTIQELNNKIIELENRVKKLEK